MIEKEQMEMLHEIFDASLPRLGPGDDAATLKALDIILTAFGRRPDTGAPAQKLRILDVGCGNGTPTIQLARNADCSILAVDNHQPFLDELRRRADAAGVGGKIELLLGDMRALELAAGPFDIIWCEGAMFVPGFREGLAAYRRYLKPGGFFATTEMTWLKPDPPEEIRNYFAEMYPAMTDVQSNLDIIKSCGYEIHDHFTLPDSAWLVNYFAPISGRIALFEEKHAGDEERLGFAAIMRMESEMFRKHSAYYGYEFFLMRR